MNLLPYNKFEIYTQLSPYDAQAALMEKTTIDENKRGFFDTEIDKKFLFQGGFKNGRFELKTNEYRRRNTVTAIALITVVPNNPGSKLLVKVRPTYHIIPILIAILGLEVLGCYGALNTTEWPAILMLVLAPLAGYAFILFMVYYKAVDFKKSLLKIFG